MGTWDEFQQPDPNLQRLRNEIVLLSEIHSKRLSDEAMAHWVKRLLPYASGQGLWTALERARDERAFPTVGWVLEHREQSMRREAKPFESPPALTPEERARSDRAAILSMLWLEYTRGFGPQHIGGIVSGCMARLYARQKTSDAHVEALLAEAREKYSREYVLAWMAEQERIAASETQALLDSPPF